MGMLRGDDKTNSTTNMNNPIDINNNNNNNNNNKNNNYYILGPLHFLLRYMCIR